MVATLNQNTLQYAGLRKCAHHRTAVGRLERWQMPRRVSTPLPISGIQRVVHIQLGCVDDEMAVTGVAEGRSIAATTVW